MSGNFNQAEIRPFCRLKKKTAYFLYNFFFLFRYFLSPRRFANHLLFFTLPYPSRVSRAFTATVAFFQKHVPKYIFFSFSIVLIRTTV